MCYGLLTRAYLHSGNRDMWSALPLLGTEKEWLNKWFLPDVENSASHKVVGKQPNKHVVITKKRQNRNCM